MHQKEKGNRTHKSPLPTVSRDPVNSGKPEGKERERTSDPVAMGPNNPGREI